MYFQQEDIVTIGTLSIIVGVVLLFFLKLVFKDEGSSARDGRKPGTEDEELFKEEPEFDRTWSFLPNNIFHRSKDD